MRGVPAFSATATDPDGSCPLTFIIVSPPSDGDLGEITDVSCSTGTATATVIYTPNDGFVGEDPFTYRVSDGTSESEEVSVGVLVGSQEPSQEPAGDTPPQDTTPGAGGDTSTGDTDAIETADSSQTSDDGDTNWTLIIIIAVAAAAATAAVATGVWWRLRRPEQPREG